MPDSESDLEVVVRLAKPEEAKRIFEINRLSWIDTYTNDELGLTKELLQQHKMKREAENIERIKERIDAGSPFYVATINDEIYGYCSPYTDESGQNRVGAIYVHPDKTGMRIGSKLIKKVIEYHKGKGDIHLSVATYNDGAIRFYKRNGFEMVSDEIEKHQLDEDIYIPVYNMVRRER